MVLDWKLVYYGFLFQMIDKSFYSRNHFYSLLAGIYWVMIKCVTTDSLTSRENKRDY